MFVIDGQAAQRGDGRAVRRGRRVACRDEEVDQEGKDGANGMWAMVHSFVDHCKATGDSQVSSHLDEHLHFLSLLSRLPSSHLFGAVPVSSSLFIPLLVPKPGLQMLLFFQSLM